VVDSLRRIVRAFRLSARAVEGRLGISAAQLFVLHQLKDADASSIDELAARTLTHQSSVSVVVGRLAKRGLVIRRTGAVDARRTEIALTSRGRALLRAAPEVIQERLIGVLGRFRPAHLRTMARQLGTLVRALEIEGGGAGMFFEEEPGVGKAPLARRSSARRRR
jgi:DNA-binding MarR family transcriptional regulator